MQKIIHDPSMDTPYHQHNEQVSSPKVEVDPNFNPFSKSNTKVSPSTDLFFFQPKKVFIFQGNQALQRKSANSPFFM